SLILIIEIVKWLFHGPSRIIERTNAFHIKNNYRKFMFNGIISLPQKWHTDNHSGNTIDKIDKGCDALKKFSAETYLIIDSLFNMIGAYLIILYFNIHASYTVLIFLFLIWIIIDKYDKKLISLQKERMIKENQISAKLYDSISNITTIIILRLEKLISKSLFLKFMSPYKVSVADFKINEYKWFFVGILVRSFMVIILATYVLSSYYGTGIIMAGTLFALWSYVEKINNQFFRFSMYYSKWVTQKASIENGKVISDQFENIKQPKQIDMHNWKELEIKNLNFGYDNKVNLKNISLTIKRNEKVAFIGESGSGKTTFLKILRDLYPIESGHIFLDNKKLKYNFGQIKNSISLIPQEPEIFDSTILNNITLGISHKLSYIRQLAKVARFDSVAMRLPNQYKSKIREKGVNLSGGEKQRLALVRGILASVDKQIVLLDEPTSSVDSVNESMIYQTLFSKFKNKTIISSIHRLHLLPMFDRIIYFEAGKIIANGTLDELIKQSPKFKKQWNLYLKSVKKHLD
ncbi:ABC transporter ATP-binding protein, partial [Candidatus Woesearchaeota archaeon]|nr:ABC transporter ATP-binding protein [Candidatus Woesearchaeota archaeon]